MKNTIVAIALVALMGCASFQSNAGKSLATVATTIDAAMKGWAGYVVAGGASETQQTEVKAVYHQYQVVMFAAETAYIEMSKTGDRTAWQKASDALTASQNQILALIKTFQTNKML